MLWSYRSQPLCFDLPFVLPTSTYVGSGSTNMISGALTRYRVTVKKKNTIRRELHSQCPSNQNRDEALAGPESKIHYKYSQLMLVHWTFHPTHYYFLLLRLRLLREKKWEAQWSMHHGQVGLMPTTKNTPAVLLCVWITDLGSENNIIQSWGLVVVNCGRYQTTHLHCYLSLGMGFRVWDHNPNT